MARQSIMINSPRDEPIKYEEFSEIQFNSKSTSQFISHFFSLSPVLTLRHLLSAALYLQTSYPNIPQNRRSTVSVVVEEEATAAMMTMTASVPVGVRRRMIQKRKVKRKLLGGNEKGFWKFGEKKELSGGGGGGEVLLVLEDRRLLIQAFPIWKRTFQKMGRIEFIFEIDEKKPETVHQLLCDGWQLEVSV
ncbi:hypothetical protein HAX54_047618 [Datura stramonium]|uniref:Uncharacterized protein n=1 Tax=Datura stramonium TaxID=4076 RepID=A0ABS8WIF6_DATST|nr:hypothetical protein [Datura stramonium]